MDARSRTQCSNEREARCIAGRDMDRTRREWSFQAKRTVSENEKPALKRGYISDRRWPRHGFSVGRRVVYPSRSGAWREKQQHRQEVTRASAQHKPMPESVVEAELTPPIKEYANGVAHSACEQKPQAGLRNGCQHRFGGDDNQPACKQVSDDRGRAKGTCAEEFQQRAGTAQRPDDAEQRPSPWPAQIRQQEWSVGAGDENEDRCLINASQQSFPPFVAR